MLANQTTESALDLRWTLSNALSALRIVLVIPTAYAIGTGMPALAIGLAVAAMITDVLDGYIARRNGEISDLGKILDPLADKIYLAVVVIQLLLLGMLPLWVVALVVARDLLILAGGIAVERRLGVVLPSNYPGKAAVVSLSITLLLIIGGAADKITSFMIGLSLILLLISLYLYAERAVLTLRGRK